MFKKLLEKIIGNFVPKIVTTEEDYIKSSRKLVNKIGFMLEEIIDGFVLNNHTLNVDVKEDIICYEYPEKMFCIDIYNDNSIIINGWDEKELENSDYKLISFVTLMLRSDMRELIGITINYDHLYKGVLHKRRFTIDKPIIDDFFNNEETIRDIIHVYNGATPEYINNSFNLYGANEK